MTVMGQQAKDIYKNQKALRDQLAEAAGAGLWGWRGRRVLTSWLGVCGGKGGARYPGKAWDQVADAVGERGEGVVINGGGGGKEGSRRMISCGLQLGWADWMGTEGGTGPAG
jgi:hypothetical protein